MLTNAETREEKEEYCRKHPQPGLIRRFFEFLLYVGGSRYRVAKPFGRRRGEGELSSFRAMSRNSQGLKTSRPIDQSGKVAMQ